MALNFVPPTRGVYDTARTPEIPRSRPTAFEELFVSVSRSLVVALCAAIATSYCGGGTKAAVSASSGAAISPAPNTTAANSQVRIREYKFSPETVHVAVGQVV